MFSTIPKEKGLKPIGKYFKYVILCRRICSQVVIPVMIRTVWYTKRYPVKQIKPIYSTTKLKNPSLITIESYSINYLSEEYVEIIHKKVATLLIVCKNKKK